MNEKSLNPNSITWFVNLFGNGGKRIGTLRLNLLLLILQSSHSFTACLVYKNSNTSLCTLLLFLAVDNRWLASIQKKILWTNKSMQIILAITHIRGWSKWNQGERTGGFIDKIVILSILQVSTALGIYWVHTLALIYYTSYAY